MWRLNLVIIFIAAAAVVAGLACTTSSDKCDCEDQTLADDDQEDDDDESDDDLFDDDSAQPDGECDDVWSECEYDNPYDSNPDCGDLPEDSEDWEYYKTWMACYHNAEADRLAAIAQCGLASDCDDWMYRYFICVSDSHAAEALCYENAATYEEYDICAEQAWAEDCNDI